jgi:uncharacterized membrane protein
MRLTSRARRERWTELLSENLWLIPGAIVLAAIALAIGAHLLDASQRDALSAIRWLSFGTPEGVRTALSAIATSITSIAALSFTITIVVLQLSSSQYSPRVIAGFLRDRLIQVILGGYLGSFVLVVIAVRAMPSDRVAPISALLGMLAGIGSLLLLVVFVHHLARSVEVSAVVARVARETRAAIGRLDPSDAGAKESDEGERVEGEGRACEVRAPKAGYVEYIDEAALAELPGPFALRVEIHVGEYARAGDVLARVWQRGDDVAAEVLAAISIGPERTIRQDLGFGLRMISDVALRALSPSLNDPTTAVHCIDVLGDLLRRIAKRGFPRRTRELDGGRRLELPRPVYEDLVRTAFEQIALSGRDDPAAATALLRALVGIAELDGEGRHGEILRAVAEIVVSGSHEAWLPSSRAGLADLDRELQRRTQ